MEHAMFEDSVKILILVGAVDDESKVKYILTSIKAGLEKWSKMVDITSVLDDCLAVFSKECKIYGQSDALAPHSKLAYTKNDISVHVLLNPTCVMVNNGIGELILSPCAERLVVYGGHCVDLQPNWVFQDGIFAAEDFEYVLSDPEITSTLLRTNIMSKVTVCCCGAAKWKLSKNYAQVEMEFVDSLLPAVETSGGQPLNGLKKFIHDLEDTLKEQVEDIFYQLRPPKHRSFLRVQRPSIYIFPAGNGDSAFFKVDGFNVLINGGALTRPWFWHLIRHEYRVDCVLATHLGTDSLAGLNSFFLRKVDEQKLKFPKDQDSDEFKYLSKFILSPDLGGVFINAPAKFLESCRKRSETSEQSMSKEDSALVQNLNVKTADLVRDTFRLLRTLQIESQSLTRKSDVQSITLLYKWNVGRLELFTLNPDENGKEIDFIRKKWGLSEKSVEQTTRSGVSLDGGEDGQCLVSDLASICCLLVWFPASPQERIIRVLFPGNTSQGKIFEGLEKLKDVDYLSFSTPTAEYLAKNKVSSKPTKSTSNRVTSSATRASSATTKSTTAKSSSSLTGMPGPTGSKATISKRVTKTAASSIHLTQPSDKPSAAYSSDASKAAASSSGKTSAVLSKTSTTLTKTSTRAATVPKKSGSPPKKLMNDANVTNRRKREDLASTKPADKRSTTSQPQTTRSMTTKTKTGSVQAVAEVRGKTKKLAEKTAAKSTSAKTTEAKLAKTSKPLEKPKKIISATRSSPKTSKSPEKKEPEPKTTTQEASLEILEKALDNLSQNEPKNKETTPLLKRPSPEGQDRADQERFLELSSRVVDIKNNHDEMRNEKNEKMEQTPSDNLGLKKDEQKEQKPSDYLTVSPKASANEEIASVENEASNLETPKEVGEKDVAVITEQRLALSDPKEELSPLLQSDAKKTAVQPDLRPEDQNEQVLLEKRDEITLKEEKTSLLDKELQPSLALAEKVVEDSKLVYKSEQDHHPASDSVDKSAEDVLTKDAAQTCPDKTSGLGFAFEEEQKLKETGTAVGEIVHASDDEDLRETTSGVDSEPISPDFKVLKEPPNVEKEASQLLIPDNEEIPVSLEQMVVSSIPESNENANRDLRTDYREAVKQDEDSVFGQTSSTIETGADMSDLNDPTPKSTPLEPLKTEFSKLHLQDNPGFSPKEDYLLNSDCNASDEKQTCHLDLSQVEENSIAKTDDHLQAHWPQDYEDLLKSEEEQNETEDTNHRLSSQNCDDLSQEEVRSIPETDDHNQAFCQENYEDEGLDNAGISNACMDYQNDNFFGNEEVTELDNRPNDLKNSNEQEKMHTYVVPVPQATAIDSDDFAPGTELNIKSGTETMTEHDERYLEFQNTSQNRGIENMSYTPLSSGPSLSTENLQDLSTPQDMTSLPSTIVEFDNFATEKKPAENLDLLQDEEKFIDSPSSDIAVLGFPEPDEEVNVVCDRLQIDSKVDVAPNTDFSKSSQSVESCYDDNGNKTRSDLSTKNPDTGSRGDASPSWTPDDVTADDNFPVCEGEIVSFRDSEDKLTEKSEACDVLLRHEQAPVEQETSVSPNHDLTATSEDKEREKEFSDKDELRGSENLSEQRVSAEHEDNLTLQRSLDLIPHPQQDQESKAELIAEDKQSLRVADILVKEYSGAPTEPATVSSSQRPLDLTLAAQVQHLKPDKVTARDQPTLCDPDVLFDLDAPDMPEKISSSEKAFDVTIAAEVQHSKEVSAKDKAQVLSDETALPAVLFDPSMPAELHPESINVEPKLEEESVYYQELEKANYPALKEQSPTDEYLSALDNELSAGASLATLEFDQDFQSSHPDNEIQSVDEVSVDADQQKNTTEELIIGTKSNITKEDSASPQVVSLGDESVHGKVIDDAKIVVDGHTAIPIPFSAAEAHANEDNHPAPAANQAKGADPDDSCNFAVNNPFLADIEQRECSANLFYPPPVREQDPSMAPAGRNVSGKPKISTAAGGSKKEPTSYHFDLTYVPRHGNRNHCGVEFFKRIKSKYYVLSGFDAMNHEPSSDVVNALLEGKKTWSKPVDSDDMNVSVIPTHNSFALFNWFEKNHQELNAEGIHLVAIGSRVKLLDENIEACKIEL